MKTLQENNVLKILIVAGITLWSFEIVGEFLFLTDYFHFQGAKVYSFCSEALEDNSYALTDEEYKFSLGKDYIFFEITDPEQLAYTYKVNATNVK